MKETPLFTVFTPSYNRAKTLPRVFQSLQAQTLPDFEWLIVDDGSTDKTQQLVQHWQTIAAFPIHYIYQPNQGKHVAFNVGVTQATGKFFVPLDSDDACTANALARLHTLWLEIPENQREQFTGVIVLCKDQHGHLVGDSFPNNKIDSNSCDIVYKLKVHGEKWGFHRTAVLAEFPLPNVGRTYLPETVLWNSIARKYKLRCVNEALRIYYSNEGNLNDQITSKARIKKNAKGQAFYFHWLLCHDLDYFWSAPKMLAKAAAQYVRFSLHNNLSYGEQFKQLHSIAAKMLWLFMLPLGYVVYLRDKYNMRETV